MWIRTQNKEDLIKCQKISIIGPGKDVYLLVELTNDNYIELGTYKSKERAIEVLDEIQNLLIPKVILNTYSIENKETSYSKEPVIEPIINDIKVQNNVNMFYQMPKEGIKCQKKD